MIELKVGDILKDNGKSGHLVMVFEVGIDMRNQKTCKLYYIKNRELKLFDFSQSIIEKFYYKLT